MISKIGDDPAPEQTSLVGRGTPRRMNRPPRNYTRGEWCQGGARGLVVGGSSESVMPEGGGEAEGGDRDLTPCPQCAH